MIIKKIALSDLTTDDQQLILCHFQGRVYECVPSESSSIQKVNICMLDTIEIERCVFMLTRKKIKLLETVFLRIIFVTFTNFDVNRQTSYDSVTISLMQQRNRPSSSSSSSSSSRYRTGVADDCIKFCGEPNVTSIFNQKGDYGIVNLFSLGIS